ncbi:MAG: phosphatase PAP2 family protein [Pseudomonadota bacterium]
MELQERAGWPRRALHLLVNLIGFSLCYPAANLLAQRAGVSAELVLDIDKAIPFVPWMIVPYMTSGLFFVLSFFLVRSNDDLRVLSQRMLLATVAGTLIFALFPLQFSTLRPSVDAPFAALFALLSLVDLPYNQLPSLHVAYALIYWHALRDLPPRRWARAALAAWLLLLASATVFTYQHHLLDVAGGALLGSVACAMVRRKRQHPDVAFYYGAAAVVVWICGVLYLRSLPMLYLAASLFMVGQAYARGKRDFLRKREGKFALETWLLYGPYLALYRLSWLCVRWHGRAKPAFVQYTPKLWVGRRLTAAEAAQLPPDCCVIDLANELSETPALRKSDYLHFHLLDLQPPPDEVVEAIVAAMLRETALGRTLYLHCAMGYSRSKIIAKIYMNRAPDDAFDLPAETEIPATP